METIENTGEKLVDINSRGKDRDWGGKKRRNMRMFDIITRANDIQAGENGFHLFSDKTLESIEHCGDWLEFAHYEDGSKKLHRANFCRHRLCPLCNWRKSLKLFGQVSKITEAILQDKKARFIFGTLTIRNVTASELTAALDDMNEGFKWLFQPSRTYSPAKLFKSNLMGYMKALEITYNSEKDTYHPHIHFVGEVRPSYFNGEGYIDKTGWKELWKGAMHLDYDPQVNIKAIRNNGNRETPDPGAVAEVAKYPIKVDNLLNIQDTDTAAKAVITFQTVCKNRRFVTFGGDFREYARRLRLSDVENGDLVHVETDENIKAAPVFLTLWKYNARFGCYIN